MRGVLSLFIAAAIALSGASAASATTVRGAGELASGQPFAIAAKGDPWSARGTMYVPYAHAFLDVACVYGDGAHAVVISVPYTEPGWPHEFSYAYHVKDGRPDLAFGENLWGWGCGGYPSALAGIDGAAPIAWGVLRVR